MEVADITGIVTEVRNARNRGDYQTAQVLLNKAYGERPSDPRIWYETGILRMAAKDHKGALNLFASAHEAQCIARSLCTSGRDRKSAERDMALSAYSAGMCSNTLGEYELGKHWLEISTALNPTASNLNAYGSTLYMLGEHTKGFLAHDKALRCKAEDAQDRLAQAFVKMLRGDPEGFVDYEARLELPGYRPHRQVDLPMWDGKARGRVLIVSEQGAGDSIMVSRYFPMVEEASDDLPSISCQPELVSWVFSRTAIPTYPHDHISLVPCDFWIPMMSLPSIFGVVPPVRTGWEPEVRKVKRVGLCWKGNPEHSNDLDRSMPEGPLLGFPADWVNLTYGEDFQSKDFLETGCLIETLDAVVSVDTAVAHLSATLGVPTILLPPTAPEWRWGLNTDTTPWYPSMRIVRRKHTRDWPKAIEQVSKLLKEML